MVELKLRNLLLLQEGTELCFLPKSGIFGKEIDGESWLLEMESRSYRTMVAHTFDASTPGGQSRSLS